MSPMNSMKAFMSTGKYLSEIALVLSDLASKIRSLDFFFSPLFLKETDRDQIDLGSTSDF